MLGLLAEPMHAGSEAARRGLPRESDSARRASGSLWELMGAYGSLWEFMGVYGSLWEFMGAYGSLRELMGVYGGFGKAKLEAQRARTGIRAFSSGGVACFDFGHQACWLEMKSQRFLLWMHCVLVRD